ncbi:2-dehydro-3-deoxyphosphogluconate aldolase/4-hydroxy-2-oxoglutarate aldolase [Nocardioides sp. PD653]|nr:2-dehydro-3-deoxyphosphogluconate aldolase/4-hydroxy-2-oxoglutarate aldolase [Nocardioides sp. PD653-B2]GAW54552.1 2-dehydro-3-deoxyphosphogluconate aldolase/4-hydroxy-2-oxoglutarate aldolase [Nocardioides sp. PD653]
MSSPREMSVLDVVPVMPVVVVDSATDAVSIAKALVAGGLPAIELTLRTDAALDAIRAIADEVPGILVGAGTIVKPEQAELAMDAGAQFLVSPGTTGSLLRAMQDTGLPFLPGTATVSEALAALEAGITELKFFPAERPAVWRSSRRSPRPSRPHGSARPAGSRPPRLRRTSRCPTWAASAAPG